MAVCRRCHNQLDPGMEQCPVCAAPRLRLVHGSLPRQAAPAPDTHDDEGDDPFPAHEPLRLLIEEPLPEMAAMIREFLQNCGIRCLVTNEAFGSLYRLPAPIGQTRVMVRESDFDEAREVVAHFFRRT